MSETNKVTGLHQVIAKCHPKLERGTVICLECGKIQKVDVAHCLANGWPSHCGVTMSLDVPESRGKV